ncbi:MAG TPA: hypothetical protein VFG91_12810 [Woeseiaceae bacterium]|nr:hypothetical protein [Woeseiaceae bacterium]
MKSKSSVLARATMTVLLSIAAAAALAGGWHRQGYDGDGDHHRKHHRLSERARIGLRASPVALDTHRLDLELVGLGSYFVNTVGSCNECHTHPSYLPGANPFMGEAEAINAEQYMAGGRQFGPFIASNLTPDEYGRPAGLTFDEFEHVLRTGRDPVDSHILQVMPWTTVGKMSRHDLRAIYEFLRAIPSLPDNPAPGP